MRFINSSKKIMDISTQPAFLSYAHPLISEADCLAQSQAFYQKMDTRRTLRFFADTPVPKAVIKNIILTASSAPSGAHKQPWTFCAVSSMDIKKAIRAAAEQEEYTNYHGRMSEEWLQDLMPFGTDWQKPFLETAPWLIIVFKKSYHLVDGVQQKNYYVTESVGIACGFLLAAIHQAGLVSLTHTPSPMNFLQKILHRPENERPFLLVPVGYAAESAVVPNIKRKGLDEVAVFF
jgi:iodotyrosine deiodinase